jgi:2-polyprenyl-3-methyl-5-hydroxy-6-metoxy-1,4-benzoquinol methylase
MKTNFTNYQLRPELYNQDYYQKSLPGLEHLDRDVIDPSAEETIHFGAIKAGDYALDFGTGRGTLPIMLAQRGCRVLGTDFSQDAINFARDYIKRFPKEIQEAVEFKRMDASELNFEGEFDAIVFNQVYEHLHNWELEQLIPKFKRALKTNGTLVVSTPNLNYIRYLYPLKRILEFPFKIVKEILRFFRGKSKHASSLSAFVKEIFKIAYPESEHTRLHINLQTPRSIRRFMEEYGFRVEVTCIDHHKNLISILMRPWWGETIWVSAKSI